MRKGYGVLILEVKDWELSSYYIDDNKKWRLENNDSVIKSPIDQVKTYKDNLYNLHIEGLLEEKIHDSKLYGIISCGVYFHKANQNEINQFLKNSFKSENDRKYIKIFGVDSLTPEKLRCILSEQGIYSPSRLFSDELYKSFKRYLQPTSHVLEQGNIINLTKKQKELVKSEITPTGKKVLGVAGSGKTQILAQRAVNAHKRTDDKVLILTYNITLKNYIHDKISQVRENFYWDNFHINNYHSFITTQFNNLGIGIELPENFHKLKDEKRQDLYDKYYSNVNIFEDFKNEISKYKVILIDELQDYKEEWQTIIRKYFWEKEYGEYVVFGDAKQNIYNRDLDENKDFKCVGIPGVANELTDTFRLSTEITNIALKFQKTFLAEKYVVNGNINSISYQTSLFDTKPSSIYKYLYYQSSKENTKVFEQIYSVLNGLSIHRNDICILSSDILILKEFDFYIRHNQHENTTTMFETKELYEELKLKYMEEKDKDFKAEIKKIRDSKKCNFWMNSGVVKLSTIHSFKGWEIDTLVLIIENIDYFEKEKFTQNELLYTAITRCRNNLIVVNMANDKYHSFFQFAY